MSLRFLAVIARGAGLEQLPEDAMASSMLHHAVATERFHLWLSQPSEILTSASGRVHVVGRLYEHADAPRRITELGTEFDRSRSVPALLSTRYWGQYVAFAQSPIGSIQVFRDPSGALPCYVQERPDRIVLFSDIGIGCAAGILTPEIDWSAVVTCLSRPALRRKATALRDLSEIPQGWTMGVGGTSYCGLTQTWSPWDHVAPSGLSGQERADALYTTVSCSVRALAAEFRRVQLCLSGGLDSSIVAASLIGSDTLCLNLVADGPEGDEREQARLVADACGFELVSRAYRLEDVDPGRTSAAHLPRPVGAPGRMAFDRANLGAAQAHGTDALFTGNGGDNVFCFMQSATPIADRLRAEGPGSGAWRTIRDVCSLTGCSLWTALERAARKLPRSAAGYRWAAERRFLNRDALEVVEEQPDHSWLVAPAGALPGRAAHVAMLMRPQNYSEGFARDAPLEMVTPLLSQPVVELCLSIPSWEWIAGGRDRAVARNAFSPVLPAPIIRRRSKGGPGAFFRQVLEHHRVALRERLLDGIMAKQRLLDSRAIETFFAGRIDEQGDAYVRILALADAEAWVRQQSR